MVRIAFAIFVVLHGMVHLLYLGQSRRLFELQPGMTWPDGSWAFSRLGITAARNIASVLLLVVAAGLVLGGVGLLARQAWSRWLVVGAAALSALLYLLLWDGTGQHLDQQGAVGIAIGVAILIALLVLRWPAVN